MGCGPSLISAPARACGPVTEDSRLEELFVAARAGDTGAVSTLLDSGFYVDCTDRHGYTALHYAAQQGYIPVARLLLKRKATPDGRAHDGHTPLSLASNEDMRDLLRSYDPEVGWMYRDASNASLSGAARPATPSGEVGASRDAYAGVASASSAADAARAASGRAAGAATPPPRSPTGRATAQVANNTKLSTACFFGDAASVAKLIAAGADVSSCDESGMTPLHWVANRGGLALAELLINAGADVNARNKDGWCPLHWAARAGRPDVARLLLDAGADASAQNALGRTPYQMTDKEGVRALLRAHAGEAASGRAASPLPGGGSFSALDAVEAAAGRSRSPGLGGRGGGTSEERELKNELILAEMRRIRRRSRSRSRSRSPSPAPPGAAPPPAGQLRSLDAGTAAALSNAANAAAAAAAAAMAAAVAADSVCEARDGNGAPHTQSQLQPQQVGSGADSYTLLSPPARPPLSPQLVLPPALPPQPAAGAYQPAMPSPMQSPRPAASPMQSPRPAASPLQSPRGAPPPSPAALAANSAAAAAAHAAAAVAAQQEALAAAQAQAAALAAQAAALAEVARAASPQPQGDSWER